METGIAEISWKEELLQIYRSHSALFYGTAMRITLHNEKASRAVIIEAFVKISKMKTEKSYHNWRIVCRLLILVKNLSLDYMRAQGLESTLKLNTIEKYNNEFGGENLKWLLEGSSPLRSDQTELLDCVFFRGMTKDEVARHLNIPAGTLKTRLKSAMTSVKNRYFNQFNKY